MGVMVAMVDETDIADEDGLIDEVDRIGASVREPAYESPDGPEHGSSE